MGWKRELEQLLLAFVIFIIIVLTLSYSGVLTKNTEIRPSEYRLLAKFLFEDRDGLIEESKKYFEDHIITRGEWEKLNNSAMALSLERSRAEFADQIEYGRSTF